MTNSKTTATLLTCLVFGLFGFIAGGLLPLWLALLIALPLAWFGSDFVYGIFYKGDSFD